MSSRSRLLHCDFTVHLNCLFIPYLPYLKYCTIPVRFFTRVCHTRWLLLLKPNKSLVCFTRVKKRTTDWGYVYYSRRVVPS